MQKLAITLLRRSAAPPWLKSSRVRRADCARFGTYHARVVGRLAEDGMWEVARVRADRTRRKVDRRLGG